MDTPRERGRTVILQGRGEARLELAIVDYEFPAMTEDPHGFDMNWLVVDIEATDGVTTERFRGPHLLTTAARQP